MIWIIIGIIVLLVILGLLIWLLVRQFGSNNKAKLNESCKSTDDCNAGLVCDIPTGSENGVCKIPSGGTCSTTADCNSGLTCVSGVCTVSGGKLNEPCPCDTGYSCNSNNICKGIMGTVCTVNADCLSNTCIDGKCTVITTDGDVAVLSSDGTTISLVSLSDMNNTTTSCDRYRSKYCSRSSSCDCSDCKSYSSKYNSTRYSDSKSTRSCKTCGSSYGSCSCSSSYKTTSGSYDSYGSNSSKSSYSKTGYSKTGYSKNSHGYSKSNSYSGSYYSSHSSDDCDNFNAVTMVNSLESDTVDGTIKKRTKSRKRKNKKRRNKRKQYSHFRKGVYVVEKDGFSVMFDYIDEPILDMTKSINDNLLMLLGDGSILEKRGIGNVRTKTNLPMKQIVRFGDNILGLSEDGKLYEKCSSSTSSYWIWASLNDYPEQIFAIRTTNDGNFLWLQADPVNFKVDKIHTQGYLYDVEGNLIRKDVIRVNRFYGNNVDTYIDIDRINFKAKEQPSEIQHRNIRLGAFFDNGELITVNASETKYDNIRVIDDVAYHIFNHEI